MAPRKFLDQVYDEARRGDVAALYDEWAATYDAEIRENGYATPRRVAQAMRATGCTGPVLDLGCGTGLSGLALRAEGFAPIDGTDLSAGMLAQAAARGIYRRTWQSAPDAALAGGYATIAAVGVISPGAAPPEMLARIAAALSPGARVAFSFNDHALADRAYTDALARQTGTGALSVLFQEHGTHLPEIGLSSTVYVLEKT